MAVGISAVFGLAWWLDPYLADGTPRRQGTHQLLGLPPCTFYERTGLPCPSCGMTTSFALLAHGDPVNALRANSVGVLMALFAVALVPWCLLTAFRRRPVSIHALERTTTYIVFVFLMLMFLRWGLVLIFAWQI